MNDPKGNEPGAVPAAQTGGGRWLRVALAVSVALNLAVAGLVGGAILKDGPPHMRDVQVRDLGFGPFTEALSREDRAALRRAFADQGGRRDLRAELRADLERVLSALRAEPFDPAALEAAFAEQGRRMTERLDLGHKLLTDFLVALPETDRRAFADRLEAGVRRGGKDRQGDGGRGDAPHN